MASHPDAIFANLISQIHTMKKVIIFLATIIAITLGDTACAQKSSTPTDYNLQKAYEVLDEDQDEVQALDLVNKQLQLTPDHVDALLLRARLLRRKGEYGRAMQDLNHALKVNKPKKSEIPNSTLHWWKATIYEDMDDMANCAASLKTAYQLARKDDKDNLQNISFDYAQALYDLDDIAGADAVYKAMLRQDEMDQAAMVGLARNMMKREQYGDAAEMLEICQAYGSDYSEVYRFKMHAYDKLGETSKAIEAGLNWFERDDDVSINAILEVFVKRQNYAEAGIKARAKASDDPFEWDALLCNFYQECGRYEQAISAYDALEDKYGSFHGINELRSRCYKELGLYKLAITDISLALDWADDWESYCYRGDYYRLSGDLDSAIADFTAAIEEAPDEAFAYYRRGWCYELKGDNKRAMEDYNTGLDLDDDYSYLYLMRGELLYKGGDKTASAADFEKVLELDTDADDGSCRMYALHYLGRDAEADEWMDLIIAAEPDDSGNYYDLACLRSLQGRPQESIAALRTAFEKGYRSFAHIRMDDDLDAVRDLPEFKALIKEYETRHAAYLQELDFRVPKAPSPINTRTI